jgi:ATP-dependent Clp protease ATP-binding subunit ClpA
MFERYTEKSRRVIFFARYEASQYGSPYIETEHLLLGLLRENAALTRVVLPSKTSIDAIRQQIAEHATRREKTSTSIDLPLSNESKRVLAHAAEEAERLQSKHIGSEHLLLGLLRENGAFGAQLLRITILRPVRPHRSWRNQDPKLHGHFCCDALLALGRVLLHHSHNQLANVFRNPRSSQPRLPPPKQLEPLTMPAD